MDSGLSVSYINHSDPRYATLPFQTFMLQIRSLIAATEVGRCLRVKTENQFDSVYQSTATAPQIFA